MPGQAAPSPGQGDAAAACSYQSAHATMALLGCHLAASMPLGSPGDSEWIAASLALVQFIQETTRPEQRGSRLFLGRLKSLLLQHGATAAVAVAAQQQGYTGDPQEMLWLCSPVSKEIMLQIVAKIWEPCSADKADKCLNAVACAVIDHWCTPQMLEQLNQDLTFEVARRKGLSEDHGITSAKQIQNIFETDDRLRIFKLPAPKGSLGLKLHWISILHSYRKAKERDQRIQMQKDKEKREREIQPLPNPDPPESQQPMPAPAAAVQQQPSQKITTSESPGPNHFSSMPKKTLGQIKCILHQACKETSLRLQAAPNGSPFCTNRDSVLRQAASQLLLDAFCARFDLSGTAKVQAADLAAFFQSAGQLGASLLVKLAVHPAFKNCPNPSKGFIHVLLGDSEKRKYVPGDSISSAAALPFLLTMMPGHDWRVQFNVDYIWQASGAVPASSAATASLPKADTHSSGKTGAADDGRRMDSQPQLVAKQAKSKAEEHASSNGVNVLPLPVLLRRVDTLLPLHSKATKQVLLCHLAARAVLSTLAGALSPHQDELSTTDFRKVLVSRKDVATFKLSATKASEYTLKMLCQGAYMKYAELAGEGPTRGLVAVLKAARCTTKDRPIFSTSLHTDGCTWSVGLVPEWIWVEAECSLLQSPLASSPSSEEQTMSAAAVQSESGAAAQSKGAFPSNPGSGFVPRTRFAGIELDPSLQAQLSMLPAVSHKSLVRAAGIACAAIVSQSKAHCNGNHAAPGNGAAAAELHDPLSEAGGSMQSTVEKRILLQAAVEVLLEGYSKTFKTSEIAAVKLATYAPAVHTIGDFVWKHAKLRLAEPGQPPRDRAAVFKGLCSAIHTQASGASEQEPPLLVLTMSNGTQRVSLTVQRLWAYLPKPAAQASTAPANQAPAKHAQQPSKVPQQLPAKPALSGLPQPMKPALPVPKGPAQPTMLAQPILCGPTQPGSAVTMVHAPGGNGNGVTVPLEAEATTAAAAVAARSAGDGGSARAWEEAGCLDPPAADAGAADLSALHDGLPSEWSSPGALMECWRVLLAAVDLVWPPPRPSSGSSRQDVNVFVCNLVAKRAVDAGIQQHLHRLAHAPPAATAPEAFAVPLLGAGQAAIDAWQAAVGAGGGGGAAGGELLSRGPLYVGALIAAWHQEQPEAARQAPLLQVLNAPVAASAPGAAAAPIVTVVRLDAASLLDLASSIQFAEELAMDLLM